MSKFYKLMLTFALSLVLMMALACGVSAHEEGCDHQWDQGTLSYSYSWYDDCYEYTVDVYIINCVNCPYSTTEERNYTVTSEHHNYVEDSYCDGTFWYYRTYCTRCGDTDSYESGGGCGCGHH